LKPSRVLRTTPGTLGSRATALHPQMR
jgi:hypothetical protein